MRQRGYELAAAFGLLTRLPVGRFLPDDAQVDYAGSVWAYPIVGATIGLIGGIGYWVALRIGLSPMLAAIWTIAVLVLVTGALHEDGLADTADGFGGGRTRERKLEIMRDSRIGSYGALALILALFLRATAIATLADPVRVIFALVVASSLARASMVLLLALAKPARKDGMAAGLANIPINTIVASLAIGALVAAVLLPTGRLPLILGASFVVGWGMKFTATRHIGGHTGDILGATALITETVLLSLLTL